MLQEGLDDTKMQLKSISKSPSHSFVKSNNLKAKSTSFGVFTSTKSLFSYRGSISYTGGTTGHKSHNCRQQSRGTWIWRLKKVHLTSGIQDHLGT